MSPTSTKPLGDSWVVDEGNISWADDSSTDDDMKIRTPQSLPRQSPLHSSRSSATTYREPDFVMPSIDETPSKPRRRVHKRSSPPTYARDTQSRTVSARSTPARKTISSHQLGLTDHLSAAAVNAFGSILDILGQTLRWLKTPISMVLAGWLVVGFATLTWNLFTSSVSNAFSPICRIPGVNFLNLPICQSPFSDNPQLSAGVTPEPEFDALMNVQSQFESIISDTATGVSLPMDMKRTETSIRDLRQIVSYSELPSRHELGLEFDRFIETARIASYDLQKFNSHVGRGVDIVLSTARWTQRVLDDIEHQGSQQGLIPAFIAPLLAPFQPVKFTESRLLDQYIKHTHVISDEILSLVEEAQALLRVLQNLEDQLEIIHNVCLRDNIKIQGDKDDLLGQLWSQIGGNQAKKGHINKQLELLRQVSQYRKVAFTHVYTTIVKLQSMEAELEELRTRVGSAEALQNAGIKHIPLSVHIENIQLGVERLEIGRERAREMERKYTRGILDRVDNLEVARDIKYLSPN